MIVIKINYSSVSPVVNVNYDESPIYVRVMYGGAGDSITEWGEIVGTLSNQTDLQNALNTKVPYSGATANVDLGEYELKAGQIELDQSPTGVAGVAVTRWNDTIGSTETTLKGGSVVLKNGVDLVARVVNKVSPNTTLTKSAYQAVRISGAQGQRLAVAFAQANNDNNSADTIGLVTETIATNQEGFIMTVGSLEGINTTGSLQGETWSDGDVLYLSPTVAGAITNVKPVAPQHLVVIGYVEYAHQNNGKIYVKIMNGWELGELHDVNTNGATNGQVLTYNGSIWVPSTNGVGTVTSVDMTVPTGLTVSGNPITSSGTLALGLASGYSIPTDANQTNWTAAYNDKINSAAVTGTTTKTLTLNQQDGGTITASWTDYDTAPVTSVFGRTGAVVATSGDYTTDQVTEGTNLYFTDARARAAISLTTTGTSGAATYVSGVLNIPQYQAALTNPITGTGTSGQIAYWNGTNTQTGSATLTYSPTSSLLVNNSVTAASAIARGTNLTPTLVAAANNDVLVGLDIAPTFTNGAFTGVANYGIRNTSKTTLGDFLTITGGGNTPTGLGNGIHISYNSTSNIGWIQSLQIGTAGRQLNIMGYPLYLGSSQSGTLHVQLSTSGNLLLQNGGTFTDGGQRLQVMGTGYFSGNVGIGIASTVTTQNLIVQSNITGATAATGIQSSSQIQSDVTSTARYYLAYGRVQNTSFTLSNIVYYDAEEFSLTGPTITNQFGYRVGALSTATNNYGFYGNIASGTNRWNLYMNGTANNYMAGSLGIGSTTLSNITLRLEKNLTGGTVAFNIGAFGTVQSDVTNQVRYIGTSLNTQAAAFTLGAAYHYFAEQGTIGAGSSVTNQYGYFANSTLIGATNNFGFYGNIPAQANAWNLYMNGTANNYMAGSLGVGTTSLTGHGLRVQKNITGAVSSNGITSDGTIQSDVTTNAAYFKSLLRTQAATFNISDVYHFYANGATLGAGSTITNQYGFLAEFNITQATNNYGFRGLIASGTGRWNLYMDGTASNYLEGDTSIGTTSLGTATKLTLGGSETASSAIARGQLINTTLTASANNDVLVGLDINPTFTVGAFTGVTKNAIRYPNQSYIASSNTSGTYFNILGTDNNSWVNIGNANLNIVNYGQQFAIAAGNSVRFTSAGSTNYLYCYTGTTGNVVLQNGGTFTDAGYRLDVNGTARVQGALYLGTGNTKYFDVSGSDALWNTSLRIVANLFAQTQVYVGGYATPNASAQLQVESTTRGFLPPRMTTTQKNAIAIPAAGLQVYDTTLNQMSYYNGTTWVNF